MAVPAAEQDDGDKDSEDDEEGSSHTDPYHSLYRQHLDKSNVNQKVGQLQGFCLRTLYILCFYHSYECAGYC